MARATTLLQPQHYNRLQPCVLQAATICNQLYAKPECCVEGKPRTLERAVHVAATAASLGFSKFGTGQKDRHGRVLLTPKDITDFVNLLAKDKSSGERRVQGGVGARGGLVKGAGAGPCSATLSKPCP